MRVLLFSSMSLLCALTESTLAVSTVGGPVVNKGETALEYRVSKDWDNHGTYQDGAINTRLHVDHAFTDIYALRIVYAMEKVQGNHLKGKEISLQNRFYLIQKKNHGWEGGIRINYTASREEETPDDLSLRFYQEFNIGHFKVRFNQIFSHSIDEKVDRGLFFEWRSQLTHPVTTHIQVGFDFFHDIGDLSHQRGYSAQQHTIGPVIKVELGKQYNMELGYRVGISSAAPNHSAILVISRSWL